MSVRDAIRRWLGVDDLAERAAHGASREVRDMRAVRNLLRQVDELRGLVHQQTAFVEEALHRAGWQSDQEAEQQKALHRALRAARLPGEVIVGPWTGEVGFELLYWIPFLGWLASQGVSGSRMTVLSRGGAGVWYRHLTSRYLDVLDLVTPDDFRERTAGKKKQYDDKRDLDMELIEKARAKLSLPDALVVHPSAMFRLFRGLWGKQATVELVESFASYRPLEPPPAADASPAGLPSNYVVAKFYFSQAFPETAENRAFVAEMLRTVSAQVPVVVLSTLVRLDEHHDAQVARGGGLIVVDTHTVPQRNLELQTRLIAGARGFIGTYGGFSYLAPLYGVDSLSFFSDRDKLVPFHLDHAQATFGAMKAGRFLACDVADAHLVTLRLADARSGQALRTAQTAVH
jgi:hypothetical protein